MRDKFGSIRKITQVNQFLRVFSGTGTRFRSREQLISVPVPVPGSLLKDILDTHASQFFLNFAEKCVNLLQNEYLLHHANLSWQTFRDKHHYL